MLAPCKSYATLITTVLRDLCPCFKTPIVVYADRTAIFNTSVSAMSPKQLALLRAVLLMMKQ